MKLSHTSLLNQKQKEEVLSLWNQEYPKSLTYTLEEFQSYLGGLQNPEHLFLEDSKGTVVGWASLFEREGENWFAIILDKSYQGKGFGRSMLSELKEKSDLLLGWVIDSEKELKSDGSFYKTPLEFYLKEGFKVDPSTRLEIPNLSAVKIVWRRS